MCRSARPSREEVSGPGLFAFAMPCGSELARARSCILLVAAMGAIVVGPIPAWWWSTANRLVGEDRPGLTIGSLQITVGRGAGDRLAARPAGRYLRGSVSGSAATTALHRPASSPTDGTRFG